MQGKTGNIVPATRLGHVYLRLSGQRVLQPYSCARSILQPFCSNFNRKCRLSWRIFIIFFYFKSWLKKKFINMQQCVLRVATTLLPLSRILFAVIGSPTIHAQLYGTCKQCDVVFYNKQFKLLPIFYHDKKDKNCNENIIKPNQVSPN